MEMKKKVTIAKATYRIVAIHFFTNSGCGKPLMMPRPFPSEISMSIIRDFKWGIVCFSTISSNWIIDSNAWKSLLRFCYCIIAIGCICKYLMYCINWAPPVRLNGLYSDQFQKAKTLQCSYCQNEKERGN